MKFTGSGVSRLGLRFLNRLGLRRAAPVLNRIPSVGIASGKGGTGKTFVTVNLAVLLSRSIGTVHVFDADLGLGNAHQHLGLKPERHLQQFFEGGMSLVDLVLRSHYGVQLLPGGSGIARLSQLSRGELRRLGRALPETMSGARALLIDSAAGLSPQTLLFLQSADIVLLTVTPNLAALTDAYALIKCLILRTPSARVLVLVNRADNELQAWEAFVKLRDVTRQFLAHPVHYIGGVPEDRAVQLAHTAKVPLVIRAPQSLAARALRAASRELERLLPDIMRGSDEAGFPQRLLETY